MKIFIGADHAGYTLKGLLKAYLSELGHEVEDKGAYEFVEHDDYPDYVSAVAESVINTPESFGIVLCGTGQGEIMVANRVSGIRAALFYGPMLPKSPVEINGRESTDPYEIVKLARLHNDANILALSARFISEDEAREATRIFLETKFSGEERHVRRLSKF